MFTIEYKSEEESSKVRQKINYQVRRAHCNFFQSRKILKFRHFIRSFEFILLILIMKIRAKIRIKFKI